MPTLNHWQRTYYADRRAWRMAFKALRPHDDGRDLYQLYRMVGGDRASFRKALTALDQNREFDLPPHETDLQRVGRGAGLPDPFVSRIEHNLPRQD